MEQITQNSKTFLRSLSIIHVALLFGQLVFLSIALFLKLSSDTIITNSFSFPFSIVVPLLVIGCLIASKVVYTIKTKQVQSKDGITDKMQIYYVATIIKLALLEGPSLFTIVVFLLTGEVYFSIFTLILVLAFIVSKPSREKAIVDLKLNFEETALIKNDDFVIYKQPYQRLSIWSTWVLVYARVSNLKLSASLKVFICAIADIAEKIQARRMLQICFRQLPELYG